MARVVLAMVVLTLSMVILVGVMRLAQDHAEFLQLALAPPDTVVVFRADTTVVVRVDTVRVPPVIVHREPLNPYRNLLKEKRP